MDRKGNFFRFQKGIEHAGTGIIEAGPHQGLPDMRPAAARKNRFMEGIVRFKKSPFITGICRFLLALQDFIQLPEARFREALTGFCHDSFFHDNAHKPGFPYHLGMQPGHKRTALGKNIQQVILPEMDESFPYRRTARLQKVCHFLFRHGRSRRQME